MLGTNAGSNRIALPLLLCAAASVSDTVSTRADQLGFYGSRDNNVQ